MTIDDLIYVRNTFEITVLSMNYKLKENLNCLKVDMLAYI